jgi:hypothetical protein
MRRNILPATLLLASGAVFFFCACTANDTRVTNASSTNSNAAANANAATGAREGAGPHDTGIGGTGEDRRDATVAGNSNVEPTGVNKNAGKAANGNRP